MTTVTVAKTVYPLAFTSDTMFKFHNEHAIFEKVIHVYLIDSLYKPETIAKHRKYMYLTVTLGFV